MQKTVFFAGEQFSCTLEIEIKKKDKLQVLSIVGSYFTGKKLLKSEKNMLGFGQIREEVRSIIPTQLYEIWKRWHLNDMRAGTQKQEQLLRDAEVEINTYDEACNYLAAKDAYIDNGYKYGSRWLKEELPQEVIDYIINL